MPWKLILFLIALVLLLIFAGLNMNNAADISFGFKVLHEVPIFVSLLLSFILGIVFSIPFLINAGIRKKSRSVRAGRDEPITGYSDGAGKKSRPAKKRKNEKSGTGTESEAPFADDDPLSK